LKAEAHLWIGPIRQVHTLKIDSENGELTPVHSTIKFKKVAPTLKIMTQEHLEYPLLVSVSVPTPERSKQLDDNYQRVWKSATPEQKQKSQGGEVSGGKGSVRYWTIPPEVQSVEVLIWSVDVGKKSFKMDFEVLQGPNTIKQKIYFQCGGGTQPYHAVLQTPGEGCVIRVRNKKFVEDGLCEIAIVPYEVTDDSESLVPTIADGQ